MRSKQKEYYSVPVGMDEIFRLRFLEASAADDYFREILTSPRPETPSPAIIFEKDGSYPGELFGIVHQEDGTLLHFFYFSTDKVLLPLLRRHRISTPLRVNLPAYQAFKAENSRLNTLFSDKLTLPMFLGDAREQSAPALPPPTTKPTPDAVLAAVLLVLLSILSHLVALRRRKTATRQDKTAALEEAARGFIQAIQDPRKRAKVERAARAQHLQSLLRDPGSARKILSFINDASHDDKVAQQVDRLLASVPDTNTRRVLRRVMDETSAKAAAATTTSSKPALLPQTTKPPQHKPPSLHEFLRQNRQHITTPTGAVSPVFTRQLTSFLSRTGISDPTPVVRALTSRAASTARKDPTMTHRKMTDALLHAITQEKTEPHVFTISPARKPPRSRRHTQQPPQRLEQEKRQQQQPRVEAAQLVRRTPGKKQSVLGAAVVDVNIQRILHESKTYAKMIPTLRGVIQQRNIRKVFVIDAPNMLAHRGYKYASRQKTTASEEFVDGMRKKLGAPTDDMMIVVSQMNYNEWVNNDPVYFGRIGPDRDNAFLVRVGCFDDAAGVDCHRSANTKNHNECDDFVRLDLMARLSSTTTTPPPPQFFHVTNDLSRNWQYIDHPPATRVKDTRF